MRAPLFSFSGLRVGIFMTSALRVVSGYLSGQVLLLPTDRIFTVGTSLESDFVLFGRNIAKLHCKVSPNKEGSHRLETLRDAIVNFNNSDVQRLELQDGDHLLIGDCGMVYHKSIEDQDDDESELKQVPDRRLLAKKSLENYRILRKIQMTEMDVTYMALDPETKKRVSVRIFKTEHINNNKLVERFLSRAMVGLTISNPHFAEIHTIGVAHSNCFIVSELVEDQTKFARFLRDKTPMPVFEAIDFVKNFCEALKHARSRKILVGRRKPSGIFVIHDNRIKITNFDLSNELQEAIVKTTAFQDFLKDKFQGRKEINELSSEHQKLDRLEREPKGIQDMPDEGVDIMMAGRVLYQLLSGKQFQPKTATKIIIDGYGRNAPVPGDENKIELVRGGPFKEYPRDILMVLAKMVTADARKRFKSLDEAMSTLTKHLTESPKDLS
jgi:serine/threonine protein kinase